MSAQEAKARKAADSVIAKAARRSIAMSNVAASADDNRLDTYTIQVHFPDARLSKKYADAAKSKGYESEVFHNGTGSQRGVRVYRVKAAAVPALKTLAKSVSSKVTGAAFRDLKDVLKLTDPKEGDKIEFSNVAASGNVLDKLEKWAGTKIESGRNVIKGYPVDINDQDPAEGLEMLAVDGDAAKGLVKLLRGAGFKAKYGGSNWVILDPIAMSNVSAGSPHAAEEAASLARAIKPVYDKLKDASARYMDDAQSRVFNDAAKALLTATNKLLNMPE